MQNNSLVSVITTFLNGEKFIRESIESVFSQTYKNWELILIDDMSTDGSTQIALEYSKKYPDKVRYLQHGGGRNRGISASRNLGLKQAKGKYIAFLDADDLWVEKKLEQQVEILTAYPDAGIVYGTTKYWYSWTGKEDDKTRDFIIDYNLRPNTLFRPPILLIKIFNCETTPPSMSNALLRRDIFDTIGEFDEAFTGMFEDQVFVTKICMHCNIYVSDVCWDLYRQHSNSCTENNRDRMEALERQFQKWLEGYFSNNNINDPDLLYLMRKRKWKSDHPTLHKLINGNQSVVAAFKKLTKKLISTVLPVQYRYMLLSKLQGERYKPQVGWVNFGELRRLNPVSSEWGAERGLAIDRYYIEQFLDAHSSDVRGAVLEVADNYYTNKYGKDRVSKSDILNLEKGANPHTTIAADITNAPQIGSNTYDCIVFTQTLQLVYDFHSAIRTLHRILKPGGVILATVAGISQTTEDLPWDRNWCWGFTSVSARKIFEEEFPKEYVTVQGYGNVLVAASFLYGLSTDDLKKNELDYYDRNYEIVLSIRAVKPID